MFFLGRDFCDLRNSRSLNFTERQTNKSSKTTSLPIVLQREDEKQTDETPAATGSMVILRWLMILAGVGERG